MENLTIYCSRCGRLIKFIKYSDDNLNRTKCCCAYCSKEMFNDSRAYEYYTIEWDD